MTHHFRNDEGSVMLFSLMFMLIITVMGLVALQTSVYEIKIAENFCRFNEGIAMAEAGLNRSLASFGVQADSQVISGGEDETSGDEAATSRGDAATYSINDVLNEATHANFKTAVYKSDVVDEMTQLKIAQVEIRRIVKASDYEDVSLLSSQANKVPKQVHRYYGGSIDWRRFAITATAYKRDQSGLSEVWVQKGVLLPAKQNSDIF